VFSNILVYQKDLNFDSENFAIMTGSAATPNQSHLEGASSAHKKSFPQAQGKLASEPAKKYVIVTCMDARLDPAAAFGIAVGDAHVIRNVSSRICSRWKTGPLPDRAPHLTDCLCDSDTRPAAPPMMRYAAS